MEFFLKGIIKDNGNLVISQHDQVRYRLAEFNGREVIIHITPYEKNVTDAQRRWYWGVAVQTIIREHKKNNGEVLDKNDVHAYNINMIVKPKLKTIEVMGSTIIKIEEFSLSGMKKKYFHETFKPELQKFWAEKNIDIPDPNEDNFLTDIKNKAYDSLRNIKDEAE